MIFTEPNKQSSFAAGAALLALSGVIVKLIGVCYKIPLMRLIGAQGMGYFNTAYDVFAFLCVISTTGLPVAVSVLISRYPSWHNRILRLSICVFAILGALCAGIVFVLADHIATWVGAPAAAQGLRFIAPAVLFICLSGALRSYYQAKRNMRPTAVSQIIEAAGKLLFGLVFAHFAIRISKDSATAASYAILGLSVGMLFSLLYLVFFPKRETECRSGKYDSARLISELLKIAFPVTLCALVTGLTKVADLSLIMRRLQDGGMAQSSAVAMYGCYSSMVIPLFGAVPALFSSIALPLVPHLGHAIADHDVMAQKQILQTAFRWCAVISVPASLGMAMLSKQILQMLFSTPAEVQIAVPMLLIISTAIPASCLITVTSAVLQAYGHPWLPMMATLLGCIFKSTCLYVLCTMEPIGILAAPISTVLCCIVTVLCNFAFIGKVTPVFCFSRHWLNALAASASSIGIGALLCRCIASPSMQAVIIIPTAMLLYFSLAFLCGLIRITDFQFIKSQE